MHTKTDKMNNLLQKKSTPVGEMNLKKLIVITLKLSLVATYDHQAFEFHLEN